MTAEHLIEVGVPAQLQRQSPAELHEALSRVARLVWSDLDLPSRPKVAVTDRPAGSVTVDGQLVPVSARHVEQAVLAGSGTARRPGEAGTPHELLMKRVQTSGTPAAVYVLARLLDTALRADLAGLVRADSGTIAQQLTAANGRGAAPLEVVTDAIMLAAEHGIAPRPTDEARDPLADGIDEWPDVLSERLARAWLARTPPRPIIEAHPSTLRRLTTGESSLRMQQIAGPGSRGLMDSLFLDYGVRPPPVSLRSADQPESVVRFRFGSNCTPHHFVLPDSQAVLMIHPDLLAPRRARPFVDPATGEIWSLVELPLDPAWPRAIVFDPSGLVIRALLAEMKTRLALWSPSWAEIPAFDRAEVNLGLLHLDMASAALRWLLSAQGSVHLVARLAEGVIAAAAEGAIRPAAIAMVLRSFLGRAVIGPLDASSNYTLVEIDGALAREAVKDGSSTPLLGRHPILTAATGQLLVSCPGHGRREVESLLRPLSDTVVVVADEELARLPCAAP